MMQPRLVKAVQKNGQTIREYPPVVVRERMCKPQTLTNLQTILERVVRIGLGKKAGSRNFHTSGKPVRHRCGPRPALPRNISCRLWDISPPSAPSIPALFVSRRLRLLREAVIAVRCSAVWLKR